MRHRRDVGMAALLVLGSAVAVSTLARPVGRSPASVRPTQAPGVASAPAAAPEVRAVARPSVPATASRPSRAVAPRVRERVVGPATGNPSAPAPMGMVVAIDPETGELGMPTREQLLELSAQELQAASRSTEGLREIHLPNGAIAIDLQGRFQEFTVVSFGPDGKPMFHCLEDPAVIRKTLTAPAAPVMEDR